MSLSNSSTQFPELTWVRDDLRKTFRSGVLRPLQYRKQQLAQLAYMIQDNVEAISKALFADGHKPAFEVSLGELAPILHMALDAITRLEDWTADVPVPDSVRKPSHKEWDLRTLKSPRGVSLIIGPWNYPCILVLGPLVGAIAAGCCAVIKPSEIASNFSILLQELVPKYLDQSAYRVITGGIPKTTALLELQWDYIIYTGSSRVGRIVATAAAKHLTPCMLELGSQSPCIIDPALPEDLLKVAAKRIMFGKTAHEGQTCVAPNCLLVTKDQHDRVVTLLEEALLELFPRGAIESDSYGRIINEAHHNRIKNLLSKTKGRIICGGAYSMLADGTFFVEPMIVTDLQRDDILLEEELFAPILPIISVHDIDSAIDVVNSLPNPLMIYLFSTSPEVKKHVAESTLSGTITFNDTLGVLGAWELPIQGVGESGYGGGWYSKAGFDAFTLDRGVVEIPLSHEAIMGVRYPPYTEHAHELGRKLLNIPISTPRVGHADAVE